MNWTYEERAICCAYISRTPVKHILERYGLQARQFYVLLKRAGIQLRGQHHQNDRNAMIARERFAGVGIKELAEKYGLSTERIRQIVRVSGALRE